MPKEGKGYERMIDESDWRPDLTSCLMNNGSNGIDSLSTALVEFENTKWLKILNIRCIRQTLECVGYPRIENL